MLTARALTAAPDIMERQSRHRRTKTLLVEALAVGPERRGAWLDRACGADALLRREVDSLLRFADADPLSSRAPELSPPDQPRLPPLAPGVRYAGRYRIDALIGEGGMGQVYRAHDTLLDVPVALKRVHARGTVHHVRFLDEARLARRVTHPGACRVHDIGEHDGETFFTMELLEGVTLARRLADGGPLPSADVIAFALQLCDVLDVAHRSGVLHGDLKPGNLMLDTAGGLHVIDFGLATATQATRCAGMLAGTPSYMAPEQLVASGVVDERTDLHGMGLVLYEALTGLPAFTADTPADLIDQAVLSCPPLPSTIVRDVDAGLEALVMALIEADPARRPSTAQLVGKRLAALALMAEVNATHLALSSPPSPSEPRP